MSEYDWTTITANSNTTITYTYSYILPGGSLIPSAPMTEWVAEEKPKPKRLEQLKMDIGEEV